MYVCMYVCKHLRKNYMRPLHFFLVHPCVNLPINQPSLVQAVSTLNVVSCFEIYISYEDSQANKKKKERWVDTALDGFQFPFIYLFIHPYIRKATRAHHVTEMIDTFNTFSNHFTSLHCILYDFTFTFVSLWWPCLQGYFFSVFIEQSECQFFMTQRRRGISIMSYDAWIRRISMH